MNARALEATVVCWGFCLFGGLACSSGSKVEKTDVSNDVADITESRSLADGLQDRGVEFRAEETLDGLLVDLTSPCEPGAGHFGCICETGNDCASGYCVLHLGEMVCTTGCVEECPEGFQCLESSLGGADKVFLCESLYPSLCLPCAKDDDCEGTGARCVRYGLDKGGFCGVRCENPTECPSGYSCTEATTVSGGAMTACLATVGECSCSSYSVSHHLDTECANSNNHGMCVGFRECTQNGLTDCSAEIPAVENCDGLDNDCDGTTDEGDLCLAEGECISAWCEGTEGCQSENLDQPCTDDGDPCTEDFCVEGACTHNPGNDGAPCDDNDPCTTVDECDGGVCIGSSISPTCVDVCGDGTCSVHETPEGCSVDCGPCGDGICGFHEAGQGGGTCPKDCLAACGNGICEGGESAEWCILDCGGCGDGVCGLNETHANCSTDCPATCGDGTCEMGESPELCPYDCMPPCGDGECGWGENPYNCPTDCTVCGDGVCGFSETAENCAQDCVTPCGNGICDGAENPPSCPIDCGPCGDGVCGWSEDGESCPLDCAAVCGNDLCEPESSETCETCPVDCGCTQCGEACVSGTCAFTACTGMECGDDGCGGSCGECTEHYECQESSCVYVPWCGDGACDVTENCASCEPDCCCEPALSNGGKTAPDANGLVWVVIPGGCFRMGCSPYDNSCDSDEDPAHAVMLSSFAILETEVTESQWAAVVPTDPSPSSDYNGGGGDDSPVESIDWAEAQSFCEAIGGRLCTEAEWEYAARGGTTTRYHCGDDSSCLGDVEWYIYNSDYHKHDVGTREPNGYGLYDMLGNVHEWIGDRYDSEYYSEWPVSNPAGSTTGWRGQRGGAFSNSEVALRVSNRGAGNLLGDPYLGARCCRTQVCLPCCDGKECGDDGCGGSCGECGDGQDCEVGVCGPFVNVSFRVDMSGTLVPPVAYTNLVHPPPPLGSGEVFITGNQNVLGNWDTFGVALRDDGQGGDSTANDYIWTGSVSLPVGVDLRYRYYAGLPGDSPEDTEEFPLTRSLLRIDSPPSLYPGSLFVTRGIDKGRVL